MRNISLIDRRMVVVVVFGISENGKWFNFLKWGLRNFVLCFLMEYYVVIKNDDYKVFMSIWVMFMI